jgi:DNA-binding GntR family transcriptional regulator
VGLQPSGDVSSPRDLPLTTIVETISRDIASGHYPAGSFLPSVHALSRRLGARPHAVRRALRQLEAAGVLGGTQGRPRVVLAGEDPIGRTRYEQVAAQLGARIAQGAMPPGARVPGESALAVAIGVSRSTIREALALLEVSGEVVRRGGRRYVAGSPPSPDLAYEVVADHVRRAISGRQSYPGGRLPGETQLAADYGVSRPTVRKALDLLGQEGLVYSVPKVGWFVAERPTRSRRPRG